MGHHRIAAALALLSLLGCSSVGSVSPLLTAEDAEEEPLLRGTWQDSSGSINLFIPADGHASYSLYLTHYRGDSREYRATLGRIGAVRVLELQATDPELAEGIAASGLTVELYLPVLVETISANDMTLGDLSGGALGSYLHHKPKAIAHVSQGDDIIITAPTSAWRRFFQKYVSRPYAIRKMTFLRRPTPWLKITATSRGSEYRAAGPGECQHVPLRHSDDPAAGLWQVRFESQVIDTTSIRQLRLRTRAADSVGAARLVMGWGPTWRVDTTSRAAPRVEVRDSTVVLGLEASDSSGSTIRVTVECSVITQIVERDNQEEDP